jgi:hypothetical protein
MSRISEERPGDRAMAGAFQGLTRADLPHASSVTRIAQQVGGAFGAAVLVVILASQTATHAAAGSGAAALAFGHTFWWCVGFTAVAVIPALMLPGRPTPAGRAADAVRSVGHPPVDWQAVGGRRA